MGQAYYRSSPFNQLGKVTLYIIAACVVVFGFETLAPELTMDWLSLIPLKVIFRGQAWRLVTYLFMHGDFSHLLFNMLTLFFFGPVLERTMGFRKYAIFYAVCGIGAGIFSVFFYELLGEADARIIGASGAIFGVITAYGVMFPNSKILLWFVVPIKAKWLVIIFGAMEFFATFRYAAGGKGGIASIAHLSGILIAYFYIRGFYDGKRLWLKYKYWRADRERKKFRVYSNDDHPTIH